jgi:hypothetical protein
MFERLHHYCCKNVPRYAAWHIYPYHVYVHWGILLIFSLSVMAGTLVISLQTPPRVALAAPTISVVDSTDTSGHIGNSVKLDASGFPVIAYVYSSSGGDLMVAHCNDANCAGSNESLVSVDSTGDVGWGASLALDSSGYPVVSYSDKTNADLKVVHCNDVNCSGADESITSPVTTEALTSYFTSLVLDASGYPVVAYTYNDAPPVGRKSFSVLHCNDVNCAGGDESNVEVVLGGFIDSESSIQLDSSGYPVIAYYDDVSDDLHILHCNDANCAGADESDVAVDTAGTVGQLASLKLDSSGYPVVSYYDTTNADLKILHCNDANCSGGDESIVSVDTTGSVGSDSSLALDSSGYPVVSYYDVTNQDLKVLHCNDANCAGGDESIVTVDSTGDVAEDTSIVLDSSGYPVISYFDDTNNDLKLAHCDNANCTSNVAPLATTPTSISQSTDAAGLITFSTDVSDVDSDDTKLKVEYSDDGGSTWYDPILVEGSTSVSGGSVDTENDNAYQIGTANAIDSSTATITVTAVWDSQNASNGNGAITDRQTDIQIRVTPNDGTDDGTAQASASFEIDNATPASLASLAAGGPTTTTLPLTWTAATDDNFNHYEAWYGTVQADVENRTGTASEWDQVNDSDLSTATTAATTITGLSQGTTYYVRLWAIDDLGNLAQTATVSALTLSIPTASTPTSISQATTGTGYLSFATTIADADSNETRLKVEYSDDGGSTWYDPDLVSAAPSQGAVDLDDANAYQIGTSDGIDTDTASTTVTITWDTKSASNGNGAITDRQTDIQVRVTANDTTYDSAVATSASFEIDNAVPGALASLTAGLVTNTSLFLTWTAATDDNFNHYEIWYGTVQADVEGRAGAAAEWDQDNDAALTNASTTSTRVTGLTPGTLLYISLFAFDDFGNETTPNVESTRTARTRVGKIIDQTPPGVPTNAQARQEEANIVLTWNDPSDTDLAGIDILRSLHPLPPSIVSARILPGVEQYIDQNIVPGEKVVYQLRAIDHMANVAVTAVIHPSLNESPVESIDTVPLSSDPGTTVISTSASVGNTREIDQGEPQGALTPVIALRHVYTQAIELLLRGIATTSEALRGERASESDALTQEITNRVVRPGVSDRIRGQAQVFIVEGTPETKILGAGQRAAAIASFYVAFEHYPESGEDWDDVLHIALGEMPHQVNLVREQEARALFLTLFSRDVNDALASDRVTIATMAYGLQFPRNMDRESIALEKFQKIYERAPASSMEWNVIRAIAYQPRQ